MAATEHTVRQGDGFQSQLTLNRRFAICYECEACDWHTTKHDAPNYHASLEAIGDEPPHCPMCQYRVATTRILFRVGAYNDQGIPFA